MALLDWLEEDEDDLPAPGIYLVPIVKKQWGSFRVEAESEEHARTEFYNSLITTVERDTTWDGNVEYDYESCGVIECED